MYDSEDIMHELFILLKGCSRSYVTDENVKQVCITHAKILCQIDGYFSCLWKVDPTLERIREAGSFVVASMETCRQIWLSVTPKSHISEDHAIDSMQAINGMGDNNEDFIELLHQYDAQQDRWTQAPRDHKHKYKAQRKADNQESGPKSKNMNEKTRVENKLRKKTQPRKG